MKSILLFIVSLLPFFGIGQQMDDLLTRIKDNPDKKETISLIQQVNIANPNYTELSQLFKTLKKDVRKSTEGKYFQRYLDALQNTLPGKKAPGITQFNIAGEPYSLQDLKGKYVLVSFWATWNVESRKQIPAYKKLYAEFKSKNLEILGVSFDSDFERWKKYVEENKMDWKHISDLQNMNNGAALSYGIKGLPQNILVDPNGIVVARNIYGEELAKKVKELLP